MLIDLLISLYYLHQHFIIVLLFILQNHMPILIINHMVITFLILKLVIIINKNLINLVSIIIIFTFLK